MSRFPILAALCLAALPGAPRRPSPRPPPRRRAGRRRRPAAVAAIQQAGMAFGQCVQTGAQSRAGDGDARSGRGQRARRLRVAAADGSSRPSMPLLATLPPEPSAPRGRSGFAPSWAAVEGQVAEAIRARRTPAPPAAAPAPAPGH